MASAFFAVLRDITKLAASAADDLASQASKMAAAADDVASLTGTAAAKTAGVAGDDLAVGAGQVSGISPNRELPALMRIVRGSAVNKLALSAILLLVDYYMPMLIGIALLLGGLYLAYEGAHGLLDKFYPGVSDAADGVLTEDEKVKGAIKTDLVLSVEMLVIALAATSGAVLAYKISVLLLVGIIMTVGVYGIIALIIRLDDMGLALARSPKRVWQRLGRGMVSAAPRILQMLDPLGMAAMFAVAGGIFTHQLHLEFSHWAVALAVDCGVGVAVGMVLLGARHLIARVRGVQAAH